MRSPLQRSLKKLRADGWYCEVSEHWNPWTKQRKDLFGFADAVCLRGNETLAVQTTSGSNVAARIAKIKANPAAKIWSASVNRLIAVHGWRKAGPRGKRKTWQCRKELIRL